MRLGDLDALKEDFDCVGFNDYDDYKRALRIIDAAQTVEPETKLVANETFNKEQMEELVEKAKADILEEIKRFQGECKTCRHRDPEDKKCDCGGKERQGCQFPVSDDYYCKYYEKGGAE